MEGPRHASCEGPSRRAGRGRPARADAGTRILAGERWGNECNKPNCMCPEGWVYIQSAGGCVDTATLTPCTDDAACGAEGRCESYCCSGPLCLCEEARGSYCAPPPGD